MAYPQPSLGKSSKPASGSYARNKSVFLNRSKLPGEMDTMQSGESLLRERGLRVTKPRLTVLEILSQGGHLEVEEITRLARGRLESVSTQAIYDVLGVLARAGLARRVEPAGSAALYEARVGDNHHHIVCRACGTVADVDGAIGN